MLVSLALLLHVLYCLRICFLGLNSKNLQKFLWEDDVEELCAVTSQTGKSMCAHFHVVGGGVGGALRDLNRMISETSPQRTRTSTCSHPSSHPCWVVAALPLPPSGEEMLGVKIRHIITQYLLPPSFPCLHLHQCTLSCMRSILIFHLKEETGNFNIV